MFLESPLTEETLAPGISIVDSLISDEHCAQIIEWLESRQDFCKGDQCSLDHNLLPFISFTNPSFIDTMHRAVHDAVMSYADDWETQFNQNVPNVHYNRYLPNEGHLDLHADLDERGRPYHISAVLYLNDDFDEGQTHFPRIGATVYPKPGKLVIFPSAYVYAHQALRPQNGTKYAVAFWFWY